MGDVAKRRGGLWRRSRAGLLALKLVCGSYPDIIEPGRAESGLDARDLARRGGHNKNIVDVQGRGEWVVGVGPEKAKMTLHLGNKLRCLVG